MTQEYEGFENPGVLRIEITNLIKFKGNLRSFECNGFIFHFTPTYKINNNYTRSIDKVLVEREDMLYDEIKHLMYCKTFKKAYDEVVKMLTKDYIGTYKTCNRLWHFAYNSYMSDIDRGKQERM